MQVDAKLLLLLKNGALQALCKEVQNFWRSKQVIKFDNLLPMNVILETGEIPITRFSAYRLNSLVTDIKIAVPQNILYISAVFSADTGMNASKLITFATMATR